MITSLRFFVHTKKILSGYDEKLPRALEVSVLAGLNSTYKTTYPFLELFSDSRSEEVKMKYTYATVSTP